MLVQIYEVQNLKEAEKLVEVGVDIIGILVGDGQFPREIPPHKAKKIVKGLSINAKISVLSLSNDVDYIIDLTNVTNPDILHLGSPPSKLSLRDVKDIKKEIEDVKLTRTVPVLDEDSIELAKSYQFIADHLLLDTYQRETEQADGQLGATGKTHDWSLSRKIVETVTIPVILAGGLGADNVARAIKRVKPFAVDCKSKTDNPDGRTKDVNKVREFVQAAKGRQL